MDAVQEVPEVAKLRPKPRHFKPARDLILVEKIKNEEGEIQHGLIFLPVSATGTLFATYKVIAVGELFGDRSGLKVKAGDTVLGHKDTGHQLFGALLMGVNDIYGKVE